MLRKKFHIPIGILIVAICAIGFLSLRCDVPEKPIQIYKATLTETPATDETAETETAETGPVHEDGTWHAQPHTAGDSRTTYEQLHTEKEQLKSAIERNTEILKEKREKYQQLLGRYEQLKEQSEIREEVKSEKAEVSEDVPVSPFGFGTYPEVPSDYFGVPIWMQDREHISHLPDSAQREIELIDRVLVKLWQQDDRSIVGGSTYRGKVYPHYENTAYIRWSESVADDATIHPYISSVKGAYNAPTAEEIEAGDIPPGFKLVDLEDAGIDPYIFLDLQIR